jgi:diguanylate cyclase (GGDEF)-like protein
VTTPNDIIDSPLLAILDCATDGIGLIDLTTNRIAYLNPALYTWLGSPDVEASDLSISEVLELGSGGAPNQILDAHALAASPQLAHPAQLLPAGLPSRRVMVRVCKLPGDGQRYLAILISPASFDTTDVSESRSPRLDPLTGLLDRTFLTSRLAALLAGDRSEDQRFVVLFIDVDGFKHVNDAFGHLVGDGVLREVAYRLKICVREHDHVVRFGGDEFVVLAEHVANVHDVEPIIDRVHAILENPIPVPDSEVTLSVSIGVTEASPEYRSPEDLLAAADRAMYATKRLSG